jgi:hypothetical protein
MLLATVTMGQYTNYIFRTWKAKRNGVAVPEDRLRSTWPAIVTIVTGCLIMGCATEAKAPWIVPAIGSFIAEYGTMAFSPLNSYLIYLFTSQASSIIASANFLRFTLASVGPLIVYPFQAAAGSGWLYTFWAIMNLIAFGGLVWTILRGTAYRLKLEPWKSSKTAEDQLRAVGAIKDVEVADEKAEIDSVVVDEKAQSKTPDVAKN